VGDPRALGAPAAGRPSERTLTEAGAPTLPAGARPAPGYEVIAHLARGRSLDVYDCWSEERDCRCALKLARPDAPQPAAARRGLLREGRLLLRLAHPHIVRAYELVERPRPALVLETLGGATLAWELAARRRRMPAEDLAFLGLQLCSALGYLHRGGVLHLDLTPSNVIVEDGRARIIDLGIARPPGRGRPGVGTPGRMAPEQARGGPLTAAADVWGVGSLLYEAASGRPALEPTDRGRVRPDPIRRSRRLPAALGAAIDACLEPAPARRPGLPALTRALEDALSTRFGPAPRRIAELP
jgi:eukaryotic-like serine/threonine-protein kinase